MKYNATLESILTASFSDQPTPEYDVKSILTADLGPVEALEELDTQAVREEVTRQLEAEGNDADSLRDMVETYVEEHEEEHRSIHSELATLKDRNQAVVSSMEMYQAMLSMEDISETDLEMTNTTFRELAKVTDEEAPVMEVEDGQFTQASMEDAQHFIAASVKKIKGWIKEKYDNMVISHRRRVGGFAAAVKRMDSARDRLNRLPQDYAIPSKTISYKLTKTLTGIYSDKYTPMLTEAELSAAIRTVVGYSTAARKVVGKDAVERSRVISDGIIQAITAMSESETETALKAMFTRCAEPWKLREVVPLDKSIHGGSFLADLSKGRVAYRDSEWIVEVVQAMYTNRVRFMISTKAQGMPNRALEVEQITTLLNSVADLLSNDELMDFGYYNELVIAYNDAIRVYNRLYQIVSGTNLPNMNSELWRALNVALDAMFIFIPVADSQIEMVTYMASRIAEGALYVAEENLKEYAKVNR